MQSSNNPEQDQFLLSLAKKLQEDGYNVEVKTPYHFRINSVLDVYPVNRRFHDLTMNKRGTYDDIFAFIGDFFYATEVGISKETVLTDKDGFLRSTIRNEETLNELQDAEIRAIVQAEEESELEVEPEKTDKVDKDYSYIKDLEEGLKTTRERLKQAEGRYEAAREALAQVCEAITQCMRT